MTPAQFIATWKDNKLTERGGAQAHFDDLCELLGVDKPRDAENYCFERGAKKSGGGDGWADVWKRGYFGWENKKPGRDLGAALKQLADYALELENPPLLVVSDRERIEIHTAFTGYPDEPRTIRIEDIGLPENLQTLRWVFTDPEKLKPIKSLAAITQEAARHFGELAEELRGRGLPPAQVAHFLTQCLFCMFAEDEGLLPYDIFTRLLEKAAADPARAVNRLAALFQAMQKGGDYGDEPIAWFNGGLFKEIEVPPLTAADIAALQRAARMDWRAIDPSIFGTLFERGLNPKKRSQLGAHYTDPVTIMKLIEPVIRRPLLAEWERIKDNIAATLAKSKKPGDKAGKEASAALHGMLERLRNFRVLDPACGSGNFLYLALKTLKDIERRINTEAEQLGLHRQIGIEVSPANVLGIELDPYAAELARVTVWIGEIQWMRQNGYPVSDRPILKPLETIENRDALLTFSPRPLAGEGSGERENTVREADWPKCDAIVGNPPFLGGSVMRGELGDDYVETLRRCFESRVPGGADLVTYWFEKARAHIEAGQCQAAGLVSTNSIRGGANRKVLERIVETTRIFEAWSDLDWVNDGAAVRVSLVGFGTPSRHSGESRNPEARLDSGLPAAPGMTARLDGQVVTAIHADLTAGDGSNLTKAVRLIENAGVAFQGSVKVGEFDMPGELARNWLKQPNPNGRSNSDVLRPLRNARDLTSKPRDIWLVDFSKKSENESALYELPFGHVETHVKSFRATNNDRSRRLNWWLHGRTGDDLRAAVAGLSRVLVTPRVAKHRFFVWEHPKVYCDDAMFPIARSDDTTFGILHSRFHELWSLRLCTWLGVGNDPRYTPTTTFETFPFPEGLTPHDTAQGVPSGPVAEAIAAAAKRLNELREAWLNPPEWVDWVITPEEEKAGFPRRPVAKPGHEADLKKRTLTNLYNVRPAWLDNAHKTLDAAVAAAYGWKDYTPEMPDAEILRRLLALNLERAAANGQR